MNIIAYLLYLPISAYITIVVGKRLHSDGIYYILDHFPGKEEMAHTLNRFLLVGYYLINLGYVAISLKCWITIETTVQLINELSFMVGSIMMVLGIMHFFNMAVLAMLSARSQQLQKNI